MEKLATLVFQGAWAWPNHADRIDEYRDQLQEWFAHDSAAGSRFIELTGPHADPGAFVDWFLPLVLEWENQAAHNEPDGAEDDPPSTGWPNPEHDGTPGTEFYRVDESSQKYLYSATADGVDWATYEERRYTEPARSDDYGLDYRYDRTGEVYEWYDESSGTWNDQAWADLFAASTEGLQASADRTEDEWDEAWAMFFRTGPDGAYEFADAVVPGQQTSGCSDVWLSHEQVLARYAENQEATPDEELEEEYSEESHEELLRSAHAQARVAVETTLAEDPDGWAELSPADIEEVISSLARDIIHTQE